MRKRLCGLAWGQALLLVLVLILFGAGLRRARFQQEAALARRMGTALLQELKAREANPDWAEMLYRATPQVAYLLKHDRATGTKLGWHRFWALAEGAGCSPPRKISEPGLRYCRELDRWIVDLELPGANGGESWQAGIWVAEGPIPVSDQAKNSELAIWALVTVCGLMLVLSQAWRQEEPLQRLARLAQEVSKTLTHAGGRGSDPADEWETTARTLSQATQELKWYQCQIPRWRAGFRRRLLEERHRRRSALQKESETLAQEQAEWKTALSALKPSLRHLTRISRILNRGAEAHLPEKERAWVHRLALEAEKTLARLARMEKKLNPRENELPKEAVNLQSLLKKMALALNPQKIHLSFTVPLPSLGLPSEIVRGVFQELIQLAAGKERSRHQPVQVGYAELPARLVFFIQGGAEREAKKISESIPAWIKSTVAGWGGSLWVEPAGPTAVMIYFSLPKNKLVPREQAETETMAEVA